MNTHDFCFPHSWPLAPGLTFAQGLTQAELLKPPADSWPTYNGDYSGQRFSPLNEINTSNVHTLSLAWATRFTAGGGGARGRRRGRRRAP